MQKKRKPIKVYIAILNEGDVCVQLSQMITQIVVDCLKTKRWQPTIQYSNVTNVDYNRNQITKMFLESDCEWLLMIDEDNPPLRNPLELIEFNKDIMVLPTLMMKNDKATDNNTRLAFNCFKTIKVGKKKGFTTVVNDGNKLFKMDWGGTGCILIRRDVLETIPKPFMSLPDKTYGIRKRGEDIYFCQRATKKGFEVWGHWDYTCSHFKRVDLLTIADLIIKAKTNEKSIEQITPLLSIISEGKGKLSRDGISASESGGRDIGQGKRRKSKVSGKRKKRTGK